MKPAARLQASIEILDEILTQKNKPADQIASAYFRFRRYIGAGDRREISARVYHILRHVIRLSWPLEQKGMAITARSLILLDDPEAKSLCTGGQHEPSPLTTEERRIQTFSAKKDLASLPTWAALNIPSWFQEALSQAYPDWEALAGSLQEEAPFDLRVNTLKATRAKVLASLRSDGLSGTPTPLSPWGIRLDQRHPLNATTVYQKGWIDVQDEGSQLIALLVDARPGMTVLDYCAGAGGKTLALGACMENKGILVALDQASWRLDRAGERLRRAGVSTVQRRALDDEKTQQWLRRQTGRFDRVLVDAPCSGTGTWRRNPDARLKLTPKDIVELVGLQSEILDKAASFVKKGGRLIYATCSVLPEENEKHIEGFLARHPHFRLLSVPSVWSQVSPDVPCPVMTETLQLLPHLHKTDGFFVAILEC